MKAFLYLIICIVVLSMGSLFILKSPNGQPWLKTSDFVDPQAIATQFSSVKNSVNGKVTSLLGDDSDPKIYKWQDEQGVWHYSDSKNSNSKAWTKPDNLTVIPAIKPLKKEHVITSEQNLKSKDTNIKDDELSRVGKVKKLMNDTNNIQTLMDNRTKVIDEQLNQ